MKIVSKRSGFTLIELLVVIAIIGILAVAFLPNVLGAPAKARDAARVADLNNIRNVLVSKFVTNNDYPTTGCVSAGTFSEDGLTAADFGGKFPTDPVSTTEVKGQGQSDACRGQYSYVKAPTGGGSFGLYAKLESADTAGAVDCSTIVDTETGKCYELVAQ